MDAQNLDELRALAPGGDAAAKVRLLREFDPAARGDLAVPDPYYGGRGGFGDVFDMVEAACVGLLEHLRAGAAAGVTSAEGPRGAGGRGRRGRWSARGPVSGGGINRALAVTLADGAGCSSSITRDAPGGLTPRRPRASAGWPRRDALRTPEVRGRGEGRRRASWPRVVGRGEGGPAADEASGAGLAALHRPGPPPSALDADNAIGRLPSPARPARRLGQVLRQPPPRADGPPRGGRGALPAAA